MNLFKAEYKKTFSEALSYYPDYIVGFITDFLLLLIVMGTNGNPTEKMFGYFLWILANGVLSEASMCISTEKQLGTLQNLMIKPYPVILILSIKTMVWFTINIVKAFFTLIIVSLLFNINGLFRFEFLYVIIIVCIGVMGFSYILASLTLMFTKVASFVNIIGYFFLFLSGSIVPVSKYLIYTNPLSYGSEYMNHVVNASVTVTNFLILLGISIFYFVAGLLFFKYTFSHSKQFKWSY